MKTPLALPCLSLLYGLSWLGCDNPGRGSAADPNLTPQGYATGANGYRHDDPRQRVNPVVPAQAGSTAQGSGGREGAALDAGTGGAQPAAGQACAAPSGQGAPPSGTAR